MITSFADRLLLSSDIEELRAGASPNGVVFLSSFSKNPTLLHDGGFAGLNDPPHWVHDSLNDLHCREITDMAYIGGKIGRSDEDPIYPVDIQDFVHTA